MTTKHKKKRTYNTRRIKKNYSYRYFEIADLFDVHPNVIARWVKDGLRRIDDKKPYLINGHDLIEYLNTKQNRRKKPCKFHEIYCCKCAQPRSPWENAVDLIISNKKTLTISGLCSVCGSTMNKFGSVKKISQYQKTFRVMKIHWPSIIESD